jgi:hypothetical protein
MRIEFWASRARRDTDGPIRSKRLLEQESIAKQPEWDAVECARMFMIGFRNIGPKGY